MDTTDPMDICCEIERAILLESNFYIRGVKLASL